MKLHILSTTRITLKISEEGKKSPPKPKKKREPKIPNSRIPDSQSDYRKHLPVTFTPVNSYQTILPKECIHTPVAQPHILNTQYTYIIPRPPRPVKHDLSPFKPPSKISPNPSPLSQI